MKFWTRMMPIAFAGMMASIALSQTDTLTLQEAVEMARVNNGTVRAAFFDVESSRSRVAQAFAAFLPTLTPSFRYDLSRNRSESSFGTSTFRTNVGTGSIAANWQLLDSGQRDLSHRFARRQLDQQNSSTVQTLREILFSVHEQFLNALRAQEQVRVSESSVERADELLKQTNALIEAKIAPEKDRLQAEADRLNARVDLLGSRNFQTNAYATLKATIGFDPYSPLPPLEKVPEPTAPLELPPLAEVIKQGLLMREDLKAQRFAIEAQKLNVQLAEKDAGISWSLDASANASFSRFDSDNQSLIFLASIPLFDGNFRKEAVRQQRLSLASQQSLYLQSERRAASEIESAYLNLSQDRERLEAAAAALRAAQENYRAAADSQRLGAEGTNLITVLTAKISLVTAESNYIDAVYDAVISEVRLRLVTGQPIPGESPTE